MAGAWKVVLTDENYVQVEEIHNLREFAYMGALNKLASVAFKVRLDHPRAADLAVAKGYIKAYHRDVLRYVGPIVTTQEVVAPDQQSLSVTSADAGWFLQKRLAGKSGTGTLWSSPTNVSTIAKALIDTTNAENETGISTTVDSFTAASSRTYKAGPYRPILECIAELSSPLDGFDWRIKPVENYVNGAVTGTKIASMLAKSVIGTTIPDALFEYGPDTLSNLYGYDRTRSRDGQANRLIHLGADAATALVRQDSASISLYKLLEEVVQAELTDIDMRRDLLDEHLSIRKNPRTLIGVTPHINDVEVGQRRVPRIFSDFDLGDIVKVRLAPYGATTFEGNVRVYGIQSKIDDNGFERVELTLEDEG